MVSKTRTQAFSGGFCAEKSVRSVKNLSKLLSTLQHLLTTSDWAIGSGDILVGSCVPSYLKAGCFRSWRGWTPRLTNEKTTWSLVTPLFFKWAMAFRMHSTCSPPGPLLDQFFGLGGHEEFFLEVEIQSSRHETRIFSTRLLYPLDHKPSTRLGSQDGVLIHNHRQRQVWKNLERE